MEYRTRPIDEAIVKQWEVGDGRTSGLIMDYQPGNGTKYMLSFQWLPDVECARHLGCIGGGVLVTWIDHGCLLVPTHRGAFLDASLVAQRFKVSKADGVVLAEIIGHIAGVKATTSDEARAEDEARIKIRKAN